jgi:hypothetical protein
VLTRSAHRRRRRAGHPRTANAGRQTCNVTAECGLRNALRHIVAYTPWLWRRMCLADAGVGTIGFGVMPTGSVRAVPPMWPAPPNPQAVHGEGMIVVFVGPNAMVAPWRRRWGRTEQSEPVMTGGQTGDDSPLPRPAPHFPVCPLGTSLERIIGFDNPMETDVD